MIPCRIAETDRRRGRVALALEELMGKPFARGVAFAKLVLRDVLEQGILRILADHFGREDRCQIAPQSSGGVFTRKRRTVWAGLRNPLRRAWTSSTNLSRAGRVPLRDRPQSA